MSTYPNLRDDDFLDEDEEVLGEPQRVPNSFNTRNIFIFVLLGLFLIIGGFLLSVTGGDEGEDEYSRLQVSEEVRSLPREARPPDPREIRDRGLSTTEMDALLGGVPADDLPAVEVRSEYDVQRQLAFQQALGLPSASRVSAPHDEKPQPAEAQQQPQPAEDPDLLASQRFERYLAALNPGATPDPTSLWQPPQAQGGGAAGASGGSGGSGIGARSEEGPLLTVQGPFPTYTIPKGTLIPIVLESSVNSDLGGMIIARTTTDIYDRTKRHVVIPRGAEVISNYGSVASVAQNRLDVAASRLNLPDGRYIDFEDAFAYDPAGRIGLRDRTDRHLLGKFGSIAVLSLTGVAVSVATGNTYGGADVVEFEGPDGRSVILPLDVGVGYRSAEDLAAQRIVNDINRILGKELDRQINRPNTIKLRSGLRGMLILGDDIDMQRPYYEGNLEPNQFGVSPFDTRAPQRKPPVAAPPNRTGVQQAAQLPPSGYRR